MLTINLPIMEIIMMMLVPDIPFRRMRRALLSVLVRSSLYCQGLSFVQDLQVS